MKKEEIKEVEEIKEIETSEFKVSENDIELLNSKLGYYSLFKNNKINLKKSLEYVKYELDLKKLQEELIKLQNWVITHNKKVVIIYEGRDAAGKGGAIRRATEYINPRHFKIVALGIPSKDEEQQWFFQRYINQLPKPGEIVFFDRSWYNRAIVEPVNGFCTKKEYKIFMSQVNEFERMLIESDTYLIKLYFSISKEEQAKRFAEIIKDPLKRWKMTAVDQKAQKLWDQYSKYKIKMFEETSTEYSPWIIINADKKTDARLESISHILKKIPYQS